MLAAIRSLFASGTLSKKVGGTADQPMGVRQGCPLYQLYAFWHFCDVLQRHMSAAAPASGLLLSCGRHVPFLCYAEHVVLLSGTFQGLQHLCTAWASA